MSVSNPAHAAHFFLLIFTIASFKLSYCKTIGCPATENEALLSFKQSLEDPIDLLSSWNNSEADCCKWEGVFCNNLTGHVDELHLKSYNPFLGLIGKMSPSLLKLKHLRYLDLSQNKFKGKIPSFIGSLASLEYLNLSGAGFHGTIPRSIGNLSSLRTLSLQDNYKSLNIDSLEWLSRLSRLEHLDLSYLDLSKANNLKQVINKLPSLVELHLKYCGLHSISQGLYDVNNSSLAILQLSGNEFRSFVVLRWIFNLRSLVFLDLSHNSFKGPIPRFSNTTKLQHIDLSFNDLNSTIPSWLYSFKDLEFLSLRSNSLHDSISNDIANLSSLNTLDLSSNALSGKIPREISRLCKMQFLDLSQNKLLGEISDTFGNNMSSCFLGSLKFLRLVDNQLSGHMNDQLGELKNLQFLDLSRNSLSGPIPNNLGKLSSLSDLRLEYNKLTGNLPESVGQLFNLEMLFITDNMLQGVVTETHFSNLTKLSYFSASENHLTLKVNPDWIPPFKLKSIQLRSWNLGVIPPWLETQRKSLKLLDLSSTGISGLVPSWFWDILALSLTHNQLRGEIPDITTVSGNDPRFVCVGSNKFSGSLPRVAHTVIDLELSNNSFSGGLSHFLCDTTSETNALEILNLGGNNLTGELPDCWMRWPSLKFVNIGNNSISGSIPKSIGFLANLQSLNLYSNKFSGQIPFSMHNCTRLMKIDISDNEFVGNIPARIGTSLLNLRILILRSNKLSGKISSDICHLNSLQIFDLSDNDFFGIIPRCVHNFTAMATKIILAEYETEKVGYSYSAYSFLQTLLESASISTKGTEHRYDTILPLVTNIDLSRNNLSGDIPKELTSLVELRSLNLSGNHLTGSIPDGIGEMKQLESLDLSRNFLRGEIPAGMAVLSSLNYLNLSYNYLTGRIPQSTQIMSLNASGFIGNQLCGPPLTSHCSDEDEAPTPIDKGADGDGESKVDWFYVFLSLGYAVGLTVVCTTLIIKKSWRETYFELVEDMWDKVCVYTRIRWTKIAARCGRSS
ncbi:hypothetical protein BUALT_Bualt13G0102800 [Buddleja alternifolia]|uniref:Leucine-rich repeat-containing N-terminal plant-type domain-containing protein n=1 Tax=Buddleja alternifolia TaxID=168488 RepID=A0AAV6WXA2_9LAMI|nr:hypothetical protein BUALT_Bualt13G0102800 [Buddleja alternifolia]